MPLVAGEEADELMPYLGLCEMLGKLVVQVAEGPVEAVDITYEGVIGRYDTRILTLGVLQGMLAGKVEDVNFVNVAGIAEERGLSAHEVKEPAAVDYLNVIRVSARDAGGPLDVAGTTIGAAHRPRFVGIYGHSIDIEPVENMVFLRARAQVPGTFGKIGTKMGEFGVNISQVTVAPSLPGEPEVMGLAVSDAIGDAQLAEVIAAAGLLDAKRVTL